ncbi:hypothetical protein [Pseudomonas sp. TCU-HL1]|nr:hypothetical protein [Pseudomonas sp. TCU-HL1]AOE85400.1 copper-binding protein [Pseudomonas sp. TCU-HL1]
MRILKHLLLPLLLILSLLGFDRVGSSDFHHQGGAPVLPVIWLEE